VVTDSGAFQLSPFGNAEYDVSVTGEYSCRFAVPSKLYVRAGATIFSVTGDDSDALAVPAQ
jgi:hypothetical protein